MSTQRRKPHSLRLKPKSTDGGNEVSAIDDEDGLLLGLLDTFQRSTRRGDAAAATTKILDQLVELLALHFTSEQLVMRVNGYPYYQVHADEHDHMLARVRDWRHRYLADEVSAEDAGRSIKALLLAHMGGKDHALKEDLRRMRENEQ
ncbi:MAG: hypothetical protein DRQ37_01125 [Gammaproteobacteria bacterium]|nr:MAG: hypothetical protein DRQ37_01125 [Gammaproteobacteria bacterium]